MKTQDTLFDRTLISEDEEGSGFCNRVNRTVDFALSESDTYNKIYSVQIIVKEIKRD